MKKIYFAIVIIFSFLLSPPATFSATNQEIQNISSSDQVYEPGEVLVKLKLDQSVENLVQSESVVASPIPSPDENQVLVVKSLENKTTAETMNDLQNNDSVEKVQPNFKYKPLARLFETTARQARFPTNDPRFPQQWWLFDTSAQAGGLSAPSAWSLENKKQISVMIAIIDSGANLDHQDLKKNLTSGRNKGVNFEQPKKKPKDTDGHGTFLAGIIAAVSKNKKGLAGSSLFNRLKAMPLLFDFTTSGAIQAINYAKAKNVPIVNASWGGYGADGFDQLLSDTIAAYPGVFVTASGNNGLNHESGNPSEKMYPCDFDLPNIICTAASDPAGNLADYSDFGATFVDVMAPGGSDTNPILGLARTKSRYTQAEGSSLSAAFVSAEAGLVKSKYPNLTAAQIISIIKNSVDLEPSAAGKVSTSGKINFKKALDLAATY